MEPNKTLFQIIKPDSLKTKTIIQNVLIMLGNRIYIDKKGNKKQLLNPEEANKKIEDRGDGTFIIVADNNDRYAVKVIFQRITAIGKQSVVSEFLKEYGDYKKIIVAMDYNNKIADYVTRHHTQIFKEASLLQDIMAYRDQPKFEPLTPTEMKQVKSEYNTNEYTTKKILKTDPIKKYFALKKGDIIRIIRPSPTSGEAIDYRVVM